MTSDAGLKLGIAVKVLREQYSLSQGDLAHMVGVTQPYVSMFESGKANVRINLEFLLKLSDVFQFKELSHFMAYAEQMKVS